MHFQFLPKISIGHVSTDWAELHARTWGYCLLFKVSITHTGGVRYYCLFTLRLIIPIIIPNFASRPHVKLAIIKSLNVRKIIAMIANAIFTSGQSGHTCPQVLFHTSENNARHNGSTADCFWEIQQQFCSETTTAAPTNPPSCLLWFWLTNPQTTDDRTDMWRNMPAEGTGSDKHEIMNNNRTAGSFHTFLGYKYPVILKNVPRGLTLNQTSPNDGRFCTYCHNFGLVIILLLPQNQYRIHTCDAMRSRAASLSIRVLLAKARIIDVNKTPVLNCRMSQTQTFFPQTKNSNMLPHGVAKHLQHWIFCHNGVNHWYQTLQSPCNTPSSLSITSHLCHHHKVKVVIIHYKRHPHSYYPWFNQASV